MTSPRSLAPVKAASVGLILATTWASAEADLFQVDVSPTANLAGGKIFSERLVNSLGGASTHDTPALSSDLGPMTAGNTYSTTVSTSYATSAVSGSNVSAFAGFSFVGMGTDGSTTISSVLVGSNFTETFSAPATLSMLNTATANNDLGTLHTYIGNRAFFSDPDTGTHALWRNYVGSSRVAGPTTGNIYAYTDLVSAGTPIGQIKVTFLAVPEPTTLFGLGVGLLAIRRARKRRSGR